MAFELLVKTNNPKALDQTVQQLGGVVGRESDGVYMPVEGLDVYSVRAVNGNVDFLEFAIRQQGYGTIVRKQEI